MFENDLSKPLYRVLLVEQQRTLSQAADTLRAVEDFFRLSDIWMLLEDYQRQVTTASLNELRSVAKEATLEYELLRISQQSPIEIIVAMYGVVGGLSLTGWLVGRRAIDLLERWQAYKVGRAKAETDIAAWQFVGDRIRAIESTATLGQVLEEFKGYAPEALHEIESIEPLESQRK